VFLAGRGGKLRLRRNRARERLDDSGRMVDPEGAGQGGGCSRLVVEVGYCNGLRMKNVEKQVKGERRDHWSVGECWRFSA
jgi:hypothetical protein